MPKDKQKVAAPVEELPLEKTNTIPNSRLSGLENKVVRLIPHDDDRRISGNEIAQMLGIDRRKITTIIASLRLKGVPIIGDRSTNSYGYYIPLTDHARNEGIATLKNELNEIRKVFTSIKNADLDNWIKEVGYEPQAI